MNKTFVAFLIAFSFFLSSCTVYTEKQSEALSRSIYAAKDSLNAARFDLTEDYITESSRIVKPPKQRIEIKSIYKKNIANVVELNKVDRAAASKQRVLIIPEKYKSDAVVVVSSEEYGQLLKDKDIYEQIEKDNKNLLETKKIIDIELIRQMEFNDKMVKDLNIMQRKLVEKDLAILQRNIIIVTLLGSIAVVIYLRIKGIL